MPYYFLQYLLNLLRSICKIHPLKSSGNYWPLGEESSMTSKTSSWSDASGTMYNAATDFTTLFAWAVLLLGTARNLSFRTLQQITMYGNIQDEKENLATLFTQSVPIARWSKTDVQNFSFSWNKKGVYYLLSFITTQTLLSIVISAMLFFNL